MTFNKKEQTDTSYLIADFEQCFEQMRHYDRIELVIIKSTFTAYFAVVGGGYTLYQWGIERNLDLRTLIGILLFIGFILGTIFLAILVRNRCYFVKVARYVNEQRNLFLKNNILGLENLSKMYTDSRNPPYFNWFSTYSWLMYLLCFLNSLLFTSVFCLQDVLNLSNVRKLLILFLPMGLLQAFISIRYLKSKKE